MANGQNLSKLLVVLVIILPIVCVGSFIFIFTSLDNSRISTLENSNDKLQGDLDVALNSLQITQNKLANVEISYNSAIKTISNLQNDFLGAQQIPYVVMKDRNFEAVFKKIDNEIINWTWPADSFEQSFISGYTQRKAGLQYQRLDFGNGKVVSVVDVTGFVEDNLFDKVIDTIYDSAKSDRENIEEIWNINNQLTTYSSEIEETPRYSLETLSEGGGDCEDKAILVASMLKSVPKNWKISLVYMDADNPTNPKTVNHVIVQVDTGSDVILIETTAQNNGVTFYDNIGVVGWFFEV